MEILYERSGGIIGRPFTVGPVDTTALPGELGRQIEALVQELNFFQLPGSFGLPPSGAADLAYYDLTVTEGDRRHRVSWHDLSQAVPPHLYELVGLVQKAAEAPPVHGQPRPAPIFRHWVRSHEEDVGDVQVFRPRDFPFPPSRGRDGFEIREDGTFVSHEIGPGDEPLQVVGRWSIARLEVNFGRERTPRTLEIVSYDHEVLLVQAEPEEPQKG